MPFAPLRLDFNASRKAAKLPLLPAVSRLAANPLFFLATLAGPKFGQESRAMYPGALSLH